MISILIIPDVVVGFPDVGVTFPDVKYLENKTM
jgi:hypothetical protein